MEREKKEIIRLCRLSKTYNTGDHRVKALDGVDLVIRENEYVAIMGPSGSGKSTLMHILGCLDSPSGGTYLLDGLDVGEMEEDRLAEIRNRKIGFVFQAFNLLPRYSALENVALPLVYAGIPERERLERGRKALEAVGLAERMEHLPAQLSGGQRQRVAVARALIGKPAIVLADEPTGNLDSKASAEVMELFGEIYRQGNTVIVVTHEEEVARYAHRVIRLRDGKIESDIKTEEHEDIH